MKPENDENEEGARNQTDSLSQLSDYDSSQDLARLEQTVVDNIGYASDGKP